MPPPTSEPGGPATRPWYKKKRYMIPLGIVVLAAIGSGLEQPDATDTDNATVAATTASEDPTTSAESTPEETAEPTPEPTSEPATIAEPTPSPEPEPTSEAPAMTREQENAVRKAQDYLDYSAFSRTGLIDQLEYDGFSTEQATFAVDSIDVDWHAQAAQKAEDYLNYSSFSRSGLIDQLQYDGFTREQAEYGADAAGM